VGGAVGCRARTCLFSGVRARNHGATRQGLTALATLRSALLRSRQDRLLGIVSDLYGNLAWKPGPERVDCCRRRGLLEGVHAGRAPTLRTGLDETGGITGRHDDVFQNSGLVGGPQDTFSIGETLHPGYFIQDKLI